MEDYKKKPGNENDKDIVFSKSIKAGKRIYYLDVKKNRKDEMFLAITESKKIIQGEGDDVRVSFEKHKIFLYKEDFEKFMTGLNEAVAYIGENQPVETEKAALTENETVSLSTNENDTSEEIKIEFEFE